MNPSGRKLPLLFYLLLILCMFSAGCIESPDEGRMFHSNYHYKMQVSTEQPVTNVTFLIPLPRKDGDPRVGSLILNSSLLKTYSRYYLVNNSNTTSFSQSPVINDNPPGYRISGVRTADGVYLKVMADTFRPETPVLCDFWLHLDPGDFRYPVNTLHPRGNESVFEPKTNLSRSYETYFLRYLFGPGFTWVSSTPTKYMYDIPVYAEYSAVNTTNTLRIAATVDGENFWRYGYDNTGYNIYSDSFSLALSGQPHGWYPAEGVLSEGDGKYNMTVFDMPGQAPGNSWEKVSGTQVFPPRSELQALVFSNSIWVIGGLENGSVPKKDVWRSSDGKSWDLVTDSPAFSTRTGPCMLAYDNRMWLIGGKDGNVAAIQPGNIAYKNDVWYSDDGALWNQSTPAAAFPGRAGHQCLVFHNRMWVIGGTTQESVSRVDTTINGTPVMSRNLKRINFSDVWSSSDGITWTPATQDAGFSPRYDHRAVVFSNRMWVINGEDKRDIWSSPDGTVWTLVSDQLPFNIVNQTWDGFSVVVTDGNLLIIGGQPAHGGSGPQMSIWYSRDGRSWKYLSSKKTPMAVRDGAAVIFHDRIWVLGGIKGRPGTNEVWFSPGEEVTEPIHPPNPRPFS